MKHSTTGLNAEGDNTSAKKVKITKSLGELLIEVSNGQYDDFRAWTVQTDCTSLNLYYGMIKDINLTHLGQALKGTPLATVDISSNNIGPTGVKEFVEALKGTNVTTVDLSFNNIGPTGAKDVAEALKNTAVKTIDITSNNIGPTGAKDFAEALKGSPVTTIIAKDNQIGPTGAKDFAEGLKGTNVRTVNVSFNGINPTGAKSFAEALKDTAVTSINIIFNNMGPIGATEFAEGLKGTAVNTIDLSWNNIYNTGAETLLTALADTQVTDVNLSENPIYPETQSAWNLASLIKKTQLLKLELPLPVTHPSIDEALNRNRDRILVTPYYIARSRFVHLRNEPMEHLEQPTLSDQSTNEQQLQYARGIIMQAPQEMAEHIISFLPIMNEKIVKKMFKAAYNRTNAKHEKSQHIVNEVKNLKVSIR